MYQIKRLFKKHIEENILKYFVVISVFAVGVVVGFLFSQNISESLSKDITQEIASLIEGLSVGNLDKIQILTTSFLKNLRIFFLIFIGGFSAFLLPLTFSVIFGYGFSIGFTVTYLSACFGVMGLSVAVLSVLITLLINVPVYISLSVVAINNCRNKKYKDGNFAAYVVVFVLLFFVSMISVLTDAFIMPSLITLICS